MKHAVANMINMHKCKLIVHDPHIRCLNHSVAAASTNTGHIGWRRGLVVWVSVSD